MKDYILGGIVGYFCGKILDFLMLKFKPVVLKVWEDLLLYVIILASWPSIKKEFLKPGYKGQVVVIALIIMLIIVVKHRRIITKAMIKSSLENRQKSAK